MVTGLIRPFHRPRLPSSPLLPMPAAPCHSMTGLFSAWNSFGRLTWQNRKLFVGTLELAQLLYLLATSPPLSLILAHRLGPPMRACLSVGRSSRRTCGERRAKNGRVQWRQKLNGNAHYFSGQLGMAVATAGEGFCGAQLSRGGSGRGACYWRFR